MIIRVQLNNVNTQGIIVHHLPDVKRHRKPTFDYYRAIIKRNIFGSGEDVSKEMQAEEIENLQPTSLKLALLGTVSGNQQNSFAVIEEINKKKQALYRVGDSVQGIPGVQTNRQRYYNNSWPLGCAGINEEYSPPINSGEDKASFQGW